MIIDSFIYYNEQKLVELRLEELKDVVDYTYIFRGTTTFRNNLNANVFNTPLEFKDKVSFVQLDLPKDVNPWVNERALRKLASNHIVWECFDDHIDPLDRIIFSDADEIPRAEAVLELKGSNFYNLQMDEYYYNFSYPHGGSGAAYSCLVKDFSHGDDLRYGHLRPKNIQPKHLFNAGWHLSCFGDAEFISNKLKNYSHWELDIEQWTDPQKISDRMARRVDIIERGEENFVCEHTTPLPRPVRENPAKYKEWL